MAQRRICTEVVSYKNHALLEDMSQIIDGLCLQELLKDNIQLNGEFLEPFTKHQADWG